MRAAEQPTKRGQRSSGEDRLSDLDEAFLYMERPNQPMQIGCIAEVDGRFERDELIAVLRERLAELPRFRQRPAHSTLNLFGVRWEDDPQFDVANHVRHVALPPPADEETLRHVVETLFATPLPPDRPLWEIHVVDGLPNRRSALLCKVHHCMSDGISALGVLERIADPSASAPGDDASATGAGSPGGAAYANGHARGAGAGAARTFGGAAAAARRALPGAIGGLLERLVAVASEPASLATAARDVGSAIDALASFVQEPITTLPFHGALGHGRRMIWRSFPLDEIESLRAAGDCTVNDAILTLIAGGLRAFLDEEGVCPDDAKVRLLVPMSVRRPGADTADLGNLITAVFPWLPVDEEDPLERLRRVREEMREIKGREMGRATAIALGALGLLPSAVEAAALRLLPDVPLVSAACTNVRGPREPLRLLGRRIAEIHPIMNLFQGVGLAFAVASYAGRVSICAATDPRLLPNGERLMQAVEESLYELRTEHWRTSAVLRIAHGIAERTGGSPASRAPAPETAELSGPAASRSAVALPAPAPTQRRARRAVDVSLLTDPDLSFGDVGEDGDDGWDASAEDDEIAAGIVREAAPRRSAERSSLSLEEPVDPAGAPHTSATRRRTGVVRRTVG